MIPASFLKSSPYLIDCVKHPMRRRGDSSVCDSCASFAPAKRKNCQKYLEHMTEEAKPREMCPGYERRDVHAERPGKVGGVAENKGATAGPTSSKPRKARHHSTSASDADSSAALANSGVFSSFLRSTQMHQRPDGALTI